MKLRWLRGDLVWMVLAGPTGTPNWHQGVIEKSGPVLTVSIGDCEVNCTEDMVVQRSGWQPMSDVMTTMPDDYPLFLVTRQHIWPIGEAE